MVVALGAASLLTVHVTDLVTLRSINRSTARRARAAAIADEQVNALRRLDISTLPTQTDGPLIGVLAPSSKSQHCRARKSVEYYL